VSSMLSTVGGELGLANSEFLAAATAVLFALLLLVCLTCRCCRSNRNQYTISSAVSQAPKLEDDAAVALRFDARDPVTFGVVPEPQVQVYSDASGLGDADAAVAALEEEEEEESESTTISSKVHLFPAEDVRTDSIKIPLQEEVSDILASLSPQRLDISVDLSPRVDRHLSPHNASPGSHGSSPCSNGEGSCGRERLIRRIFSMLDVTRKGRLGVSELRALARFSGFDDSDDLWALEFASLCRYLNCSFERGLDLRRFTYLVNDRSQQGCFCSDAELQMFADLLFDKQ